MSTRGFVLAFVVLLLGVLGSNSVYVVTEQEGAVLLEFGRVVRNNITPGLHIKKPFINDVMKYDSRVLTLDAAPERFLTLDRKIVVVYSSTKFRVSDAETFYISTFGYRSRIDALLRQRINSGLRNEMSKLSLHEVITGERDEMMMALRDRLNAGTRMELGVEIVDVRVKKIDLPE